MGSFPEISDSFPLARLEERNCDTGENVEDEDDEDEDDDDEDDGDDDDEDR